MNIEELEFIPRPRPQSWNFSHLDEKAMVLKVAEDLEHPFYYYHLDRLQAHIENLATQAQGIVKLWYACKSNPLSHVLQTMKNCGLSFDIASPGELAQVLRQSVDPKNILVTGPAKSKNLLRRYLSNGIRTFVLESENQVKWLNELAQQYQVEVNALIRLQIDWSNSASSVLGGNNVTPFGLEAEQWQSLNLKQYKAINIIGIHSFQWGNILDEQQLCSIWHEVCSQSKQLANAIGFPLKVMDLGGGIGIPYIGQEKRVSWSKLMSCLAELKDDFQIEDIWMELGRYAVGEYGHYVTKVIDKKVVRGKAMLVLDSGMNQLARPTLTKQGFPVEALSPCSEKSDAFQIHGPLCTALDNLGNYCLPKDIQIGDWIQFNQCGAYGFTESMPYFLCHSLPGEGVIKSGTFEMVRMPRAANHYLV